MQAIDDFFNGNLKDAKRRARRYSRPGIRNALIHDYGKTLEEAVAIVDYLKDGGSFQAACDAELKARA